MRQEGVTSDSSPSEEKKTRIRDVKNDRKEGEGSGRGITRVQVHRGEEKLRHE